MIVLLSGILFLQTKRQTFLNAAVYCTINGFSHEGFSGKLKTCFNQKYSLWLLAGGIIIPNCQEIFLIPRVKFFSLATRELTCFIVHYSSFFWFLCCAVRIHENPLGHPIVHAWMSWWWQCFLYCFFVCLFFLPVRGSRN